MGWELANDVALISSCGKRSSVCADSLAHKRLQALKEKVDHDERGVRWQREAQHGNTTRTRDPKRERKAGRGGGEGEGTSASLSTDDREDPPRSWVWTWFDKGAPDQRRKDGRLLPVLRCVAEERRTVNVRFGGTRIRQRGNSRGRPGVSSGSRRSLP